jgi:hypothetical protein
MVAVMGLKPARISAPSQTPAKSEITTSRKMSAIAIATSGGTMESHPGKARGATGTRVPSALSASGSSAEERTVTPSMVVSPGPSSPDASSAPVALVSTYGVAGASSGRWTVNESEVPVRITAGASTRGGSAAGCAARLPVCAGTVRTGAVSVRTVSATCAETAGAASRSSGSSSAAPRRFVECIGAGVGSGPGGPPPRSAAAEPDESGGKIERAAHRPQPNRGGAPGGAPPRPGSQFAVARRRTGSAAPQSASSSSSDRSSHPRGMG